MKNRKKNIKFEILKIDKNCIQLFIFYFSTFNLAKEIDKLETNFLLYNNTYKKVSKIIIINE